MKILITGGNGYIAKSLFSQLKNKYNITLITRKNFDLTDPAATLQFFSNKNFDIVIHCAVSGGSRLKVDTEKDLDDNLKMYFNLLNSSHKFKKFIHFGSGAEIYAQNTPYGLSKHVIRQSILNKDNFYNIRIFGIFDENESDTRFIKRNIKNYINKSPLEVYENKLMDFFYMQDFYNLIEYYITNETLKKEINCSYQNKKSLLEIANFINTLDKHQVLVNFKEDNLQQHYCGLSDLPIDTIGLEKGIKNTFRKLKELDS